MTRIGVLFLAVLAGPALAAPLVDTDGDGVPDGSDCAPNAPGVSAPPQEIGPTLTVGKSATDSTIAQLRWTRSPQGNAASVYRGPIAPGQEWTAPSCLQAQRAYLDGSDPQVPVPGDGFYYLVSALNTCGESAAGRASPRSRGRAPRGCTGRWPVSASRGAAGGPRSRRAGRAG